MKQIRLIISILAAATAANLASCGTVSTPTSIPTPSATFTPASVPPPTAASQPATFSDPFAYCQAVGTIDSPDARYAGEKVPTAVAKALQKAMGLAPDAPLDFLVRSSQWRCMEGRVYGCSVGANIPCEGKADLSQTPNAGMREWCQAHPNDAVIPAAATGRTTVYSWRCSASTPAIVKQVFNPDARGFLAEFWYALSAN